MHHRLFDAQVVSLARSLKALDATELAVSSVGLPVDVAGLPACSAPEIQIPRVVSLTEAGTGSAVSTSFGGLIALFKRQNNVQLLTRLSLLMSHIVYSTPEGTLAVFNLACLPA